MKKIQLGFINGVASNGRHIVIVDDEDYDFLMQWSWYAKKERYT
jgi:hypothetical protein